ncbi:hypothetical protein ACFL2M_00695 [Patescibacteria group bacterium]
MDSDEGIVLNSAWQLWQGKAMYTDFVEYTTPGAGYLIYGVWNALGEPSYLSAKLTVMVLLASSAVGLALLVQLLLRDARAGMRFTAQLAVMALWLVTSRVHSLVNYNMISSIVAVWLLYLVVLVFAGAKSDTQGAVQKEGQKSLVVNALIGGCAGLVFLFLQTKGLALAAVSLVAVEVRRRQWLRRLVSEPLIIRYASFCIVVGAIFLWQGGALWRSVFVLPYQINYIGNTIHEFYIGAIEGLIVLLIVGAAMYMKERVYWVLALFQLGLFASSVNLVDVAHLFVNLFPFWVALVCFLYQVTERVKKLRWLVDGLFAVLIIGLLFMAVPEIRSNISGQSIIDDIRGEPQSFITEPAILEAEHIYVGPFSPGVYFELRKPNPFTEVNNLVLCDVACLEWMVERFKEVEPEFALFSYDIVEKYGYDQDNLFDSYIRGSYQYCEAGMPSGNVDMELYARDECP